MRVRLIYVDNLTEDKRMYESILGGVIGIWLLFWAAMLWEGWRTYAAARRSFNEMAEGEDDDNGHD